MITASDLNARAALYAHADPSNDPSLAVPNRGCVYCHATVAEPDSHHYLISTNPLLQPVATTEGAGPPACGSPKPSSDGMVDARRVRGARSSSPLPPLRRPRVHGGHSPRPVSRQR